MQIDIITIFPKMFAPVLNESIIKRAQAKGLVKINIHDLRDYTQDKHRKVDDRPFGGGPGMVFRPEPIFRAVEAVKSKVNPSTMLPSLRSGLSKDAETKSKCRIDGERRPSASLRPSPEPVEGRSRTIKGQRSKVILLTPQGKRLNQKLAQRLSRYKHLILICGHYEGVDERVRRVLVTDEISIGDYVLTCGELPAMVLIDTIIRLIPGVLGKEESTHFESFSQGLLEYPQYTRPAVYRRMSVPKILLSGNHQCIERWRREKALEITRKKRPDLLSPKFKLQNPK